MWLPLKVLARIVRRHGCGGHPHRHHPGAAYRITLPDERQPAAPKLQPVNIHARSDAFHCVLLMLDVEAESACPPPARRLATDQVRRLFAL